MVPDILERVLQGHRLTAAEGEILFSSKDLLALGQTAGEAVKRKNPNKIVSYIVDRNINYTNVCISACRFCAADHKEP